MAVGGYMNKQDIIHWPLLDRHRLMDDNNICFSIWHYKLSSFIFFVSCISPWVQGYPGYRPLEGKPLFFIYTIFFLDISLQWSSCLYLLLSFHFLSIWLSFLSFLVKTGCTGCEHKKAGPTDARLNSLMLLQAYALHKHILSFKPLTIFSALNEIIYGLTETNVCVF